MAENLTLLASSRAILFADSPLPEESWNLGTSWTQSFQILGKKITATVDYFYTSYQRQLIVDLDTDVSSAIFRNNQGQSFAHSFQAELKAQPLEGLELKAAYKRYDLKAETDGRIQQVAFVPSNRFFFNAAYVAPFEKWKLDLTAQWYGSQRLPSAEGKAEPFRWEENSPDFWVVNAQVSRGFRWGQIYVGVENALNFRQNNPIIDPDNPFGNNFDGLINWGPVIGRMFNVGFRYIIE